VDLVKRTITMTIGGKQVKTALPERIKTITHVGYCLTNAISDFSTIMIKGE